MEKSGKRKPPVLRHVLSSQQRRAAAVHLGGGTATELGKRVLALR